MDMKHIMPQQQMHNTKCQPATFCIIYIYYTYERGGNTMVKMLAKLAEKYAKSTNTACFIWTWLHQPKMPASLIKKD